MNDQQRKAYFAKNKILTPKQIDKIHQETVPRPYTDHEIQSINEQNRLASLHTKPLPDPSPDEFKRLREDTLKRMIENTEASNNNAIERGDKFQVDYNKKRLKILNDLHYKRVVNYRPRK